MATLSRSSVKLFSLARNGASSWKPAASIGGNQFEQKRFESGGNVIGSISLYFVQTLNNRYRK